MTSWFYYQINKHSLLETLVFPADFHGQNNPQEYLRILLRLRGFLRIKMPQEHPQVTNILLRIFLLNNNPV